MDDGVDTFYVKLTAKMKSDKITSQNQFNTKHELPETAMAKNCSLHPYHLNNIYIRVHGKFILVMLTLEIFACTGVVRSSEIKHGILSNNIECLQECIPVGCVPPTHNRTGVFLT